MLKQDLFTSLDTLVGKQAGNNPLALAFSGGGDSTALLALALQWLGGQRKLYALIVDHGLRVGSAAEAQQAAKTAQRLGAHPIILTWQGTKPKTGIQEKARLARYGLMGTQCRTLGVDTLLLGHNRNDQAETVYMRGQNNSGWRGMAGMRAAIKAPIWPELYGITIVRPMLGISRAKLRDYNHANDLTYYDDPSNENRQFSRIQARDFLQKHPRLGEELYAISQNAARDLREETAQIRAWIGIYVQTQNWGGLSLKRDVIAGSNGLGPEMLRKLGLAVSGQGQASARNKYRQLFAKINANDFQGATLGGAQYSIWKNELFIMRDPGQVLGRVGHKGLAHTKLRAGIDTIWDGRFIVRTMRENMHIVPLANYEGQLDKALKQKLKLLPVSARATLPALVRGDVLKSSPLHKPSSQYEFQSLITERLLILSE